MVVVVVGMLRGACRCKGETGLMACHSVIDNGICGVVLVVKGK